MTTMRRWLVIAGGVWAIASSTAAPAFARDLTAAEKANVKVVQDFSASWASGDVNKITSYLADDCVVRFLQTQEPVKGRTVVADRLKGGLKNSKIVFEVLETNAAGPVVMNVRNDYITAADGKKQSFKVAGVFYVRGGKIVEWIDAVIEEK
jgi:limonene-1,2-epoxide hydrolase